MTLNERIAHIYCDEHNIWHIQTIQEHCDGVSMLASKFASDFSMGSWGQFMGLLHDRGKDREGFQLKIRKNSGYDITGSTNDKSEHSYIGAVIAHNRKEDALHWISNPIAGHHRGLYDTDELKHVLANEMPEGICRQQPSSALSMPSIKPHAHESSHVVRMLFSCLVDADRLDTENFMQPGQDIKRNLHSDVNDLKRMLDSYVQYLSNLPRTNVNILRTQIQDHCMTASADGTGFYSLSVPTGGGKTIASMIWAINHAIENGKRRIIVAIPYTSIIVQTAQVLRNIFGKENVLEHHSAMNEDNSDDDHQLATENWDKPIIVTTNVQLIESLFSNKPSKCRKLHNICNSVIIFDEAQAIPTSSLQPIVDAMQTYRRLFNTSFLFCTATQPLFGGKHKGIGLSEYNGIMHDNLVEIIPSESCLHKKFQRVELKFLKDALTIESIASRIADAKKMLCIVNTRKLAYELYETIEGSTDNCFHLSRNMCPAHIIDTLDRIKVLLEDPEQEVRLISTQLVEAGVDLDFPAVMRQMAGLDSILQAAGRCNRNGMLDEKGTVEVFNIERHVDKGSIGEGANLMKEMHGLYPSRDWFDPESIRLYYERMYCRMETFDKYGMKQLLDNPMHCCFEEASNSFKMIDNPGITVIVNYGDSETLVSELRQRGPSRRLSRELGKYSVSLPLHAFKRMKDSGLIECPCEGFYYVPYGSQYDARTGLSTENSFSEETIII